MNVNGINHANRRCELQTIAKCLDVSLKPKELRKLVRGLPVDDSNPLYTITPDKCILCSRCVWECRKHGKDAVLGYAYRGFDRAITTFGYEAAVKTGALTDGKDGMEFLRVFQELYPKSFYRRDMFFFSFSNFYHLTIRADKFFIRDFFVFLQDKSRKSILTKEFRKCNIPET